MCARDCERAPRVGYGLFVGFGGTVGIGVRPTGGLANGSGDPDGLADGFGANPQMLQLKRP